MFAWIIFGLSFVFLAHAQSDFMCPPNSAMGLCTDIPNPCFGDSDCQSGFMCCPHACSRVCKPKSMMSSASGPSAPDLLNHPRVYVGKCADSSCFSLFGGEPNECDTSNLCPAQKFCCNDGCRNVCQWVPQVAAAIAREKARQQQEHMMRVKKQQEEMKRRMLEEQQKRIQLQAKIAAEAEIARAKKRAELQALAEAQQAAAQKQQQEIRKRMMEEQQRAMAQYQQRAIQPVQQPPQQPSQQPPQLQQQQPQQQPLSQQSSFLNAFSGMSSNQIPSSLPSPSINAIPNSISTNAISSNNIYNINNDKIPPPQPFLPPAPQGFFNARKTASSAGNLENRVDSFASRNPYSMMPQQSTGYKSQIPYNNNPYRSHPSANQQAMRPPPANQITRFQYPPRAVANQMRGNFGASRHQQSRRREDPMESLLMYEFLTA